MNHAIPWQVAYFTCMALVLLLVSVLCWIGGLPEGYYIIPGILGALSYVASAITVMAGVKL